MKLTDHLSENSIFIGLEACDKQTLLYAILDRLVSNGVLEENRKEHTFEKLMEREKTVTTGIGNGYALPHAITECGEKLIVSITTVQGEGVEFASLDGAPVNIVFLVICPECFHFNQIKILSSLSRLSRTRAFREKFSAATTSAEALAAIAEFE